MEKRIGGRGDEADASGQVRLIQCSRVPIVILLAFHSFLRLVNNSKLANDTLGTTTRCMRGVV